MRLTLYRKHFPVSARFGAIALAAIFGLLGLGPIIMGVVLLANGKAAAGAWMVIGIGAVFLGGAGISAFFVPRLKNLSLSAQDVPDWSHLVDEVEQAFHDTPYTVVHTPQGLQVGADLADPRFLEARAGRAWSPLSPSMWSHPRHMPSPSPTARR